MLFPIGDDHIKGKYKPIVTYLLIVINCFVFWKELQLSDKEIQDLFFTYGAVPAEIMNGRRLHTLITSTFLHAGWMHLIGNMMFLWIFADNIEITVGNLKFAVFYILGGIFGAALHSYLFPQSQVPCIGASGAISAALGAYLVLYPASKIRILFFFFIFRVSAFTFLIIWIFQQASAGWASIAPDAVDTDNVGYWAHIGGFAFGFIFGFAVRLNNKRQKTANTFIY